MKGAKRLASEITEHLMTVNYGDANSKTGDRYQILQWKEGLEYEIGGRSYSNVCKVIEGHLRRHRVGNRA